MKKKPEVKEPTLAALKQIVAKQELAILELGGRMERMERVVCGMMGQGVYRSDLEVMKKWMGNRWVVARGEGFGLPRAGKKVGKK
jgi:hypothetical protein